MTTRSKFKKYDVTLRRDVQQKVVFCVEAKSRQEAIDTAESVAAESEWLVEEIIGTHRPSAAPASKATARRTAP